ncbi:predicted protein [Uncinocarpus reesii 1704]|uniref:Pentatricopeptide repeat protein n=1 Tax=Uncinocarpus reesii (strain UAMH 1704) TaxID=336963 RepID=C4JEQ3_UNCRE|nr:uncharacterized protein UREG_02213 [Uncinocarpus reesii 1704]EEP77364.1 predicted protein [Uncinocarpus reesii 1704]
MACSKITNTAMALCKATPTSTFFWRPIIIPAVIGVRYKHAYLSKNNAFMSKEALKKELKWVGNDRVALMGRIEKMLTGDEFEKAVALVMAAEKEGVESIASWNALLSEELKKNGPEMGFKLFNDLKKRGVKPNAHTYSMLFRELADHPSKKAVQIGMSLYDTLRRDSTVPPSIQHTNAMLQVCSNHNNMGALWEIVGELPTKGPGAPDNVTYSTILGAIHKNAKAVTDKLHPIRDDKLIKQKKIPVLREGRLLWADIVARWREGERNSGSRRSAESQEDEYGPTAAEEISSEVLFKPVNLDDIPVQATPGFGARKPPKATYPLPTNPELTIILRACRHFAEGPAIGKQYWTMLTAPDGPFKINPDRTSYHEYLRTLRATRSSALSLQVIEKEMIPKGIAFTNTFIIALSTCFRDKNNPNVLETAGALIDLMPTTWAGSHPKPLSAYIDLVRNAVLPRKIYADTRIDSPFPERDPNVLYKNRLLDGINHLTPHIKKLQQFIRSRNRRDAVDAKTYGDREETLEHGASSPAALADESHLILKRIAGMVKDLLDPSIAPSLSDDETKQLSVQASRLQRILNPGPPLPP